MLHEEARDAKGHTHIICFYLYKMSKVGKSLKEQNRADYLLPRAWEWGKWKRLLNNSTKFPHGGKWALE